MALLTASSFLFAADKNGVSPNTVSLPSGPGSIEGLGEAFQPMLNAGTARYAVNVALPAGVAGHAPTLTLQYDSGLGDGPASLGWVYGPGHIGRQVDKGLPRYVDAANDIDDDHDGAIDEPDEIDTFLGPDGEELVPFDDGIHRARIEGSFARYRRVGDVWHADLKSGTKLVFGSGPETRISDADGERIFRWLLETSTDRNGNHIQYSYAFVPGSDNQKYLKEIRWAPGTPDGWTVFYFVSFGYEDKPDWRTDYRGGFLVRTAQRFSRIDIGIQGVQPDQWAPGDWMGDGTADALIGRYRLTYDDASPDGAHLTGIGNVSDDPPIIAAYRVGPGVVSSSPRGRVPQSFAPLLSGRSRAQRPIKLVSATGSLFTRSISAEASQRNSYDRVGDRHGD